MSNNYTHFKCKLIGFLFLLVQLSLSGQYSHSHDSVLALVQDEPDPFTKGYILDSYDRSLMTHDSLEKWSVTAAFIELGREHQDISFTADGYARQEIYYISKSDFVNGTIDIHFTKSDSEQFKLKISDDGVGKESKSAGFGKKLIKLLTQQLGAQVTQGNDGGYWTQIEK